MGPNSQYTVLVGRVVHTMLVGTKVSSHMTKSGVPLSLSTTDMKGYVGQCVARRVSDRPAKGATSESKAHKPTNSATSILRLILTQTVHGDRLIYRYTYIELASDLSPSTSSTRPADTYQLKGAYMSTRRCETRSNYFSIHI